MKNTNIIYLFILFVFAIASCDKDDEVGSQGPVGPQGETGATGATGAQGDTGVQGNANVHSSILQLTPNDWTTSGSYGYVASAIDSDLTQSIVDSGLVSVFYFITSSGSWTPLPYNQIITYNSYVFCNWTFFYKLNQINFRVEQNIAAPNNPGYTKFKVIAISASQRNANPNINWNDYEEVKTIFNLKD